MAASMGALLFVAGDEREILPHHGYLGTVGGEERTADDMADHYSVGGYLEYARWGL